MNPTLARVLIAKGAIRQDTLLEGYYYTHGLSGTTNSRVFGRFLLNAAKALKNGSVVFDVRVKDQPEQLRILCDDVVAIDGMDVPRFAGTYHLFEDGTPMPQQKRRGRRPRALIEAMRLAAEASAPVANEDEVPVAAEPAAAQPVARTQIVSPDIVTVMAEPAVAIEPEAIEPVVIEAGIIEAGIIETDAPEIATMMVIDTKAPIRLITVMAMTTDTPSTSDVAIEDTAFGDGIEQTPQPLTEGVLPPKSPSSGGLRHWTDWVPPVPTIEMEDEGPPDPYLGMWPFIMAGVGPPLRRRAARWSCLPLRGPMLRGCSLGSFPFVVSGVPPPASGRPDR